jgi:hypothetical protein
MPSGDETSQEGSLGGSSREESLACPEVMRLSHSLNENRTAWRSWGDVDRCLKPNMQLPLGIIRPEGCADNYAEDVRHHLRARERMYHRRLRHEPTRQPPHMRARPCSRTDVTLSPRVRSPRRYNAAAIYDWWHRTSHRLVQIRLPRNYRPAAAVMIPAPTISDVSPSSLASASSTDDATPSMPAAPTPSSPGPSTA